MNNETRCPECGAPLPTGSPRGHCPKCLLRRGLEANTLGSAADPSAPSARWTPPAPEELAPRFPELDILELIGRGGMGAVYKARQKKLNRVAALKILPPEIGRDTAFADRFAHEAQAMALLAHPHIVAIYDFGDRQGLYFFLMEYVDGLNLRQLLDSGNVAPKEALAIVPQICEALQFAHDQGIVHRDIKPENILLDKRGQVKIADFGLAKLMGQPAAVSPAASEPAAEAAGGLQTSKAAPPAEKIMGTPDYMAPEQVDHPKDVDHRADIYSLGVVFYQMLTGELPRGRFEPPSHKVLIDVRLDEVVLRALEKEPGRRYQQASQVKTEVETILTTPLPASTALAGKPPVAPGVAAGPTVGGPAAGRTAAEAPGIAGGSAVAPRFSRKAIIGAAWAPLFFIAFLAMFNTHVEHMPVSQPAMMTDAAGKVAMLPAETQPHGPTWWQILLMVTLLPLGLAAPFGTTILGSVALSQIRRSAGRLTGLGLALFDVLFFPLLALDGLIYWRWTLIYDWLHPGHYVYGENIIFFTIVTSLIVDAVIIWLSWRAARKPVSGAPAAAAPAELSPQASGDAKKRSVLRTVAIVAVVILVPIPVLVLLLVALRFAYLGEERVLPPRGPPAGVAPSAADNWVPAPAWGEGVEGVQVRLGSKQTQWVAGDAVTLETDCRNQGPYDFTFDADEREIEMDGQWYQQVTGSSEPRPHVALHPGENLEGQPVRLDRSSWYTKAEPHTGMVLSLGKHRVRVAWVGMAWVVNEARTGPRDGHRVIAISDPVTIEIVPEVVKSAAPQRGESVRGLELSVLMTKAVYTQNEPVEVEIGIENISKEDRLINLGMMLGDGRRNPDAIRLGLLNLATGVKRELAVKGTVAGARVDEFAWVKAGKTWTRTVRLADYMCPADPGFDPGKLSVARYVLTAEFEGRGRQPTGTGDTGPDATAIWTGRLTTGPEFFRVKEAPVPVAAAPAGNSVGPTPPGAADKPPAAVPSIVGRWRLVSGPWLKDKIGQIIFLETGTVLVYETTADGLKLRDYIDSYAVKGGEIEFKLKLWPEGPTVTTYAIKELTADSLVLSSDKETLTFVRATSDQVPAATASGSVAEPPWGAAVQGAQARLRPLRPRWAVGETPAFVLDLRNRTDGYIAFSDAKGETQRWELKVDGNAYREKEYHGDVRWSTSFGPGQDMLEAQALVLDDTWAKDSSGEPPAKALSPGKHTVLLTLVVQPASGAPAAKPVPGVRAATNTVEIEILPAGAKADLPPWGEGVEGLQLRLRPDVQRTTGLPKLDIDIRNLGTEAAGFFMGNRRIGYVIDNNEFVMDGSQLDLRRNGTIRCSVPAGQERTLTDIGPDPAFCESVRKGVRTPEAGLHTLRVILLPERPTKGTQDFPSRPYMSPTRVISNLVIFEILPAEAKTPAPSATSSSSSSAKAAEPPWGEAVEAVVKAGERPAPAADALAAEEKAASAILALGGKIARDDKLPGNPVVNVDLSGTQVTDADLKVLREFSALGWLDLSFTAVTDAGLKEVKDLKGLQVLGLSNTHITDAGLADIHGLKALQTLTLSNRPVSDAGLAALRDLSDLRWLALDRTQITDAGLKNLKGMKNLETLILTSTKITDAGMKDLKELKGLQTLDLMMTKITDAGLKDLKELKGLEKLDLRITKITDAGMKDLKELAGLRELNLGGDKITDAGLKELKELKSLQTLGLSGTQITDAGMKDLKELKGLRTLDLIMTKITDAGLKDLKELKGLEKLDLRITKITDAGMKDLKELEGLRELNLESTEVTDAGMKDVKELKGLQTLSLSGLKLTDACLEDLKELKGLQRLDLGGLKLMAVWLWDLNDLQGTSGYDPGGGITDAGLKELRQALPNTTIIRVPTYPHRLPDR